MHFKFNKSKAIATVLYVCKKLREAGQEANLHKIFKVLYFADQKHLARYGRPIVGDYYVAMEHGPVPSHIYDILKAIRDGSILFDPAQFKEYFEVKSQKYVIPKQAPDMEEFSESDLECLDESLNENGTLSFGALKKKSHDLPYQRASENDKISFSEMAKEAGATEEMLSFIADVSENESIFE